MAASTANQSETNPQDERIIDIMIFKEHIKNKISNLLEQIPDEKDFIVDPAILGPLKSAIQLSLVKQYGLKDIHLLTDEPVEQDSTQVIFWSTPKVQMMKRIAKTIYACQQKNLNRQFSLVISPRRTLCCKEALEILGVYGNLRIIDFNFDLIPLENDLLSMELDESFKELYVDQDLSIYKYVADSIQRLQQVYGYIPQVYLKGTGAKIAHDIVKNMEGEGLNKVDEQQTGGDIDYLIIIDRNIDQVTPLCTQLTYEGLIDENFGINNSIVKVDAKVLNKTENNKQELLLNNSDTIYKEIRNFNFQKLKVFLSERVEVLQKFISEKDKKQTVTEMSDYVKKFKVMQKEYQQVTYHINIADFISGKQKHPSFFNNLRIEQGILIGTKPETTLDHIEMLIAKQAPITKVLRLLCLQSLVDNGLKQKQLDYFRREILQTYGFKHILTLNNLEKCGLLKKNEQKSQWESLDNQLKLIYEDVNNENPNDASYAYSGYCPITVRLVEAVFQKNSWRGIVDALKILPGPTVFSDKAQTEIDKSKPKQVALVYFIGGITFAEISALRYVAKAHDKEIIIATTNIINGNTLIEQLQETVDTK